MNYLMDFSSFRSALRGLGSYGFPRYLREKFSTDGLTQLLDIARLIDLIILSDEILVSERIAHVDSRLYEEIAQEYMPQEIMNRISFISLNDDPGYFADFALFDIDADNLRREVSNVERLLGFKVVEDFVHHLENDLTEKDFLYVQTLADKIHTLTSVPEPNINEAKSQVFNALFARTLQYLQTADAIAAPYICHAYRSPLVRMLNTRLTTASFDLYGECESKIRSWLIETFGSERLEFQLPMFFLAVIKDARSPYDLFYVASDYRHSKEATQIRELLSEIRDKHNQVNLRRYAELRRVADEETKRFQQRFSTKQQNEAKGILSAELSVSPASISPKASMDLLKLSKGLVKRLTERKNKRGVAMIFRTARKVYEVLSIEKDLYRLWGAKLTYRHRDLLRQITQHCDT